MEEGEDVFRGHPRHGLACFHRGRGRVRSEDHVVHFAKFEIVRGIRVDQGLGFVYIETGPRDLFLCERFKECFLVHNRSARCVHEERGWFHELEFLCTDEVARGRKKRNVKRNNICVMEDRFL